MNSIEASRSVNLFEFLQAVEGAPSGKLTEQEKNQVIETCKKALSWLDSNTLAEKEEYEHKMKEVQSECQPIMMKLHGAGGQSGGRGGPTVEEVD